LWILGQYLSHHTTKAMAGDKYLINRCIVVVYEFRKCLRERNKLRIMINLIICCLDRFFW